MIEAGFLERWRHFRRADRGIATVELAFVLPVLLLLLLGIVEFGLVTFAQSKMVQAARDTARQLALGTISDEDEAKAFAEGRVGFWGSGLQVAVVLKDDSGPDVSVTISAPMSEAAIVDPLNLLSGYLVSAKIEMREE